MRISFIAPALCSGMLLAGCGGADTNQTSEASNGQPETTAQTSAPATEPTATVQAPATDAAPAPDQGALLRKGKIVYLRCRSCHTMDEGGLHLTGPNLHGLFGATAGQKEGYAFSDPLANSNIIWEAETLDAWLKQPSAYVEGNRMVFAGLPKTEDREALIVYLREETK